MERINEMDKLVLAIARLDSWLESMRQPRGYGGPVAHWWQHCMLYTGPGIDWRYEGILAGYQLLFEKTGQLVWKQRLRAAAEDVVRGQREDGSYIASQFEQNPGNLGTPHEAAATLGLLTAFRTIQDEQILDVARRNLDHLIRQLWDADARGFNDMPGIRGRVPNKLATLAECLIAFYEVTNEEQYLDYARVALDCVLAYQLPSGAVHQYGHGALDGDEKLFPFYNARCVPPLVRGAVVLGTSRYREAAERIMTFLTTTMNSDGSWDQIVYMNGRKADSPRWIAGAADILRSYQTCHQPFPGVALERILNAQLDSGGFPTAEGFAKQFQWLRRPRLPAFQDVLPVVGWNDKTFRFFVEQLDDKYVPLLPFVGTRKAIDGGQYIESIDSVQVVNPNGHATFMWHKGDPWSQCTLEALA